MNAATPETFIPTEVAYQTPGEGWRRRIFKTQKALDKFVDGLDDDVTVQTRDA